MNNMKIAFFSIPAHGHTNPTLEVVRELVQRGHEIRYYSFGPFQEKIEATGAQFCSCDFVNEQMEITKEEGANVGQDVGLSIELLVNTTLALDETISIEMKEWRPDCIVADSMAVWGKFVALKFNIPFVSSTTTFAFNQYSSKIMKQSVGQMFGLLKSMPKIQRALKKLKKAGYPVKNLLSIIQNENDTNTIVYTSREFQPCAETFSENYAFVGPLIRQTEMEPDKELIEMLEGDNGKKLIYISLGTVNNKFVEFYKACIKGFGNTQYQVILSVGEMTELSEFEEIPENIIIRNYVNQIEVLKKADVFISHCGMNSVSESLYYEVPLVLYPQTAEQGAVARRVFELGAGKYLKKEDADSLKNTIWEILTNPGYKENAKRIGEGFRKSGGVKEAVHRIENMKNGSHF